MIVEDCGCEKDGNITLTACEHHRIPHASAPQPSDAAPVAPIEGSTAVAAQFWKDWMEETEGLPSGRDCRIVDAALRWLVDQLDKGGKVEAESGRLIYAHPEDAPSRHAPLPGQQGLAGNRTAVHGGPPSDAAPVAWKLAAREIIEVDAADILLRAHPYADKEDEIEAWEEIHVRWRNAINNLRESLAHPEDAPAAWLAEDHRFTPVKRSLHFEESTAKAHHGTHSSGSDEPIALYSHPKDAPLDVVHRQVLEGVEKLVQGVAHLFEDAEDDPFKELPPTDADEPPWKGWYSCEDCNGWFCGLPTTYEVSGDEVCQSCQARRDAATHLKSHPEDAAQPETSLRRLIDDWERDVRHQRELMQDEDPTEGAQAAARMAVFERCVGELESVLMQVEDAPGGPWWMHTAEGGWTLHCDEELGGFEEGVHLSEDHGFSVEAAEGVLSALNRDVRDRLRGDEK